MLLCMCAIGHLCARLPINANKRATCHLSNTSLLTASHAAKTGGKPTPANRSSSSNPIARSYRSTEGSIQWCSYSFPLGTKKLQVATSHPTVSYRMPTREITMVQLFFSSWNQKTSSGDVSSHCVLSNANQRDSTNTEIHIYLLHSETLSVSHSTRHLSTIRACAMFWHRRRLNFSFPPCAQRRLLPSVQQLQTFHALWLALCPCLASAGETKDDSSTLKAGLMVREYVIDR